MKTTPAAHRAARQTDSAASVFSRKLKNSIASKRSPSVIRIASATTVPNLASGHVPRGDLHAVPLHAILVDVDAEARAIDALDMAPRIADRLRGHVLGEPDMR